METRLKRGQVIYIDNEKYKVMNMIEYKDGIWMWQEYEIQNDLHQIKWLSIEKDEKGIEEYCIYEAYCKWINENEESFIEDGIEYNLYEKGIAVVKDYFGHADVDINEQCSYTDYMSADEEHVISIERWEGEVERSKGEYIDKSRIKFTGNLELNNNTIKRSSKKVKNSILGIIEVGFILIIFLGVFSKIFFKESIEKYIEGNSSYTYVTSITNNVNNKKAKIYKSPYSSIDETVKNIIDGVPEEITDVIDSDTNTEEDGIGIYTSKEFAYVYIEGSEVYVQVSEKAYADNDGGSTYHRHHRTYYYRTYRSSSRSSTYTTYTQSARQQSVNSRTSSGGGTSAGK